MKSDEIDRSIARLRQFWLSDGNPVLQPPVIDQEILAFQQANKINIPPDFLAYLKCQNGFNQYSGHQDARGFNFWPLQDIDSLDNYEAGRNIIPGYSSYFLFCDYMDFSWGYAICMSEGEQTVVLVGTRDGKPKFVADSFMSFIDAYVNDAPSIYL